MCLERLITFFSIFALFVFSWLVRNSSVACQPPGAFMLLRTFDIHVVKLDEVLNAQLEIDLKQI
jgi:hypothetical protein